MVLKNYDIKKGSILENNILKKIGYSSSSPSPSPSLFSNSAVQYNDNKIKLDSSSNRSTIYKNKKILEILNIFNFKINSNILSVFKKEFNALTLILENFFNCPIQLEITRIYYPFYDSNILAEIMGINGKLYNFERIAKYLFARALIRNPKLALTDIDLSPKSKKSIVSYLSGIKIRVAGRFYKHRIIPRKTVSNAQRGTFARNAANLVETSRYINKSKRGSFSITVSISHIF